VKEVSYGGAGVPPNATSIMDVFALWIEKGRFVLIRGGDDVSPWGSLGSRCEKRKVCEAERSVLKVWL